MAAILNENNKFPTQTNLGWTFTFQPNGKYPVIDNRIFNTLEDVSTYLNDLTSSAIPGLILRVINDPDPDNNGAYLISYDDQNNLTYTMLSTCNDTWIDEIDMNGIVPNDQNED